MVAVGGGVRREVGWEGEGNGECGGCDKITRDESRATAAIMAIMFGEDNDNA